MRTGSDGTRATTGETAALLLDAAASSAGGVRHGTALYTYADIMDTGAPVSARLTKLGAAPSTVVAVSLPPGPRLLSAVFSVVSQGLCYLYVDPEWPRSYQRDLLRWARARYLVTEGAPGASGLVCERVEASDSWPEPLLPEDTMCLVATSGTTGVPKLVAMTQSGIARLARGAEPIALSSSDRVLALAHPGFGASLWETWAAVTAGAELVVPTERYHSLSELTGTVLDHSVSVAHLSAGIFRQLTSQDLDRLSSLRLLMTGGDTVSPASFTSAHAALEASIVACYGCTENTVFTSLYQASPATRPDRPLPLGDPLPGTGVHVLDENLAPVEPGAHGELYVTGDGLTAGYANSPEATEQRFLNLALGPGGSTVRAYRTGDLARRDGQGGYELCGRGDRQVQVRGFRLELADVELRLCAQPDVRDAHVLQVVRGEERELVAFVVQGGDGGGQAALMDALRAGVPSYMVPDRIVELDSFPLTERGKVDRRALERLLEGGARVPAEDPGSEDTERVLRIWTEVLERTDLGADDLFGDKGGHSLRATRVLSRILSEFGVDVSVRDFYKDPTVRGTVRAIDRARGEERV